jgi:D-alanyl-D-alanine carboxypeptidase
MGTVVGSGAPGVVVWIWDGRKATTLSAGLADLHTGKKLTPAYRFRIASITKSMVASVVLQLVEEGKFALSDTVQHWLPGLIPRGNDITISELLSHRSGLVDFIDIKGFDRLIDGGYPTPQTRHATARSVVALAAQKPLEFQPGRQASYSSTNYLLLGLIIEKVTGASLEENLRSRIFKPLNMTSASLHVGPLSGTPMARGYVGHRDVTNNDLTFVAAAGGAVMNAEDVGRFLTGLFSGDVIGDKMLSEMTKNRDGAVQFFTGYGYGLAQFGPGCGVAYGHSGRVAGYLAEAWMLKSHDRAVVVLTNGSEATTGLESIVETALCS